MKYCPECGFDISSYFSSANQQPKYCPECGESLAPYLGSPETNLFRQGVGAPRNDRTTRIGFLPFLLAGAYGHHHDGSSGADADSDATLGAGAGFGVDGYDGFDMGSGDFGADLGSYGDFGGGFDCGGF